MHGGREEATLERFAIAVLQDVEGKPVVARVLDSSNEALTKTALEQAGNVRWPPALVAGVRSRYIAVIKPEFKLH